MIKLPYKVSQSNGHYHPPFASQEAIIPLEIAHQELIFATSKLPDKINLTQALRTLTYLQGYFIKYLLLEE